MDWFEHAGLGLFVHWDHSSQRGVELSWPLVGRDLVPGAGDDVTVEEYQATAETFDPTAWDPEGLAALAKRAGARYLVFTARHHAGYAMFHTATTDFSIESSPYGADIVRSFVGATRAAGLKVGLYYSLPDWNHPDYPRLNASDRPYNRRNVRRPDPAAWERYVGYVKQQLTELLTAYGEIDLLWFDGEWERTAEEWRAAELDRLIRSLQPQTIVNDRLPGHGDYVTPEQGLPARIPSGPWELCLTMNRSWGWRPRDTAYKSGPRIARYLAEVAALGGNLLLNVSPMGDGSLPAAQVERLEQLAAWVSGHSESVLDVDPGPASVRFYGPVTARGSRLYLHLVMRPVESIVVRGLPVNYVTGVALLGTGEALPFEKRLEIHVDTHAGEAAHGELEIMAPQPSGALHDVVVVELDRSVEAAWAGAPVAR